MMLSLRSGWSKFSTRRVTPPWPEIGLRQEPDQALERCKIIFGAIDHRFLVLCEIVFSAAGIAK